MKTRGITICLCLFALSLCSAAQAALSQEDAQALFTQANQTFSQANAHKDPAQRKPLFDKAILLFERLIQDGDIHNAKLYYNLANAYLHNQNIGKAILNYRKAQALDQNNEDIRKNLAYARSQRMDQVDLETQTRILHTLFFWHYDFSLPTRFALACVFFGLACTGYTLMLWRPRKGVYLIWSSMALALCVCLAISIGISRHENRTKHYGVIVANEITARQGDSHTFPPSFKAPLHAGTEFKLLESRTNWLHIQLDNGSKTWIPDNAGEII